MDPKDEVVSEIAIDPETGNPDKGNEPVYMIVTTYKDGHTVSQRYKRGTGNGMAPGTPGAIPDQPDGSPINGVDKVVKEAWDKEQAKQQTQTDQKERKVKRTYEGTDPQTGKPATVTEYESGDPSYVEIKPPAKTRQIKSVTYEPGVNGRQVKVTTYDDDSVTREDTNPDTPKPSTPNAQTQVVGGVTYERDPSTGKWKPAVGLPNDPTKAPNKYVEVKQDPNTGKWFGITAQGQWEAVEGGPGLAGTTKPIPASATGWTPDPSKTDWGIFARRQEVAGMLESGVFGDPALPASQAKANDLLKQDYDHAALVATNLNNIAKGEETIYGGQVRQREADQNQANARLREATQVFDGAIKDIFANAGHLKGKGAGAVAVGAINAILEKTRALAEQFGGLVTPETIQPGAHMTHTAPEYQPIVRPAPGEPAMAPVVQPGAEAQAPGLEPIPPPTITPAAPFTPPSSGAPATAPPTQGPFAPVTPAPPLSEQTRDSTGPGYPGIQQPTSITDRAQQARQMFGAAPPQVAPPAMPPVTSPNIAAASASPLIQQAQAPTQGGTLAWARSMNFSPEILQQWIAMQGQQPAA